MNTTPGIYQTKREAARGMAICLACMIGSLALAALVASVLVAVVKAVLR